MEELNNRDKLKKWVKLGNGRSSKLHLYFINGGKLEVLEFQGDCVPMKRDQ